VLQPKPRQAIVHRKTAMAMATVASHIPVELPLLSRDDLWKRW